MFAFFISASRNINNIVRSAARIMKSLKEFHQERSFTLTYRVSSLNHQFIEIEGVIRPDIPIWGKYVIKLFSRNVKMKMKFFKDDVIVHGNKVYFELRSFAFDKMDHREANIRYEEAKNICAKFLGVTPETLQAEAQNETTTKAGEF